MLPRDAMSDNTGNENEHKTTLTPEQIASHQRNVNIILAVASVLTLGLLGTISYTLVDSTHQTKDPSSDHEMNIAGQETRTSPHQHGFPNNLSVATMALTALIILAALIKGFTSRPVGTLLRPSTPPNSSHKSLENPVIGVSS